MVATGVVWSWVVFCGSKRDTIHREECWCNSLEECHAAANTQNTLANLLCSSICCIIFLLDGSIARRFSPLSCSTDAARHTEWQRWLSHRGHGAASPTLPLDTQSFCHGECCRSRRARHPARSKSAAADDRFALGARKPPSDADFPKCCDPGCRTEWWDRRRKAGCDVVAAMSAVARKTDATDHSKWAAVDDVYEWSSLKDERRRALWAHRRPQSGDRGMPLGHRKCICKFKHSASVPAKHLHQRTRTLTVFFDTWRNKASATMPSRMPLWCSFQSGQR